MKNLAFSFLILAGCAHKNLVVKNFETTNSLCLDALVVNMTNEGCTMLNHSETGSYVTVKCQETDLGRWTEHEYYLFQTGTALENENSIPLCSDMNVSISFSKIEQ